DLAGMGSARPHGGRGLPLLLSDALTGGAGKSARGLARNDQVRLERLHDFAALIGSAHKDCNAAAIGPRPGWRDLQHFVLDMEDVASSCRRRPGQLATAS